MKGKGFHVDVVQEHLEKEAEVGFNGQWRELGTGYWVLGTGYWVLGTPSTVNWVLDMALQEAEIGFHFGSKSFT